MLHSLWKIREFGREGLIGLQDGLGICQQVVFNYFVHHLVFLDFISLSPFVNTIIVSNFYFDLVIKLCLYQPTKFTFCFQFFPLSGLGGVSEELGGCWLNLNHSTLELIIVND